MKKTFTALLTLTVFLSHAHHIGYLLPAGGKRGTEVEILVGGQRFWGLKDAIVSGDGITVTSVEYIRGFPHPYRNQRKYITDWLKAVSNGKTEKPPLPQDTDGWMKHPYYENIDKLEPLQREQMLRFLFVPRNSLQMSPAIASLAIVKLKIAPDAQLGKREFRLFSNGRISNPLSFFVSDFDEVRDPYFPLPPNKIKTPEFKIPAILNGQIMPGETDYFTFDAKRGEILTFTMLGRALMPFIGDGVPGFFQPQMEILNTDKKRVAFVDDTYFNPDGTLEFKVPETGNYTLVIRDALYRGREDFVYRITAERGTKPYPIAAPPEFPIPTVDAEKCGVLKREVMIRGTIDKPGKTQIFHLVLEKDKPVVMEVFARRINSPLDSLLKLYDSKGKMIASNDDFPRMKIGIFMQHTDSFLKFTPSASGKYTLAISDTTGHGGKDYAYFLRIDKPRPRFSLYTVPSLPSVARNGNEPIKVFVERFEDFNGPITLNLENGFIYSISGTNKIPAGVSESVITLKADRRKSSNVPHHTMLRAVGKNGYETFAVPADETMQAFAYTHIVPAERMMLTQRWKYGNGEKFSWAFKETTRRMKAGVPMEFPLKVAKLHKDASMELNIANLPEWLTVAKKEKSKLTLLPKKDSAGKAANLLFKVNYSYNYKDKKGAVKRRKSEIVLPALTVEVVP